jgi:uncharacterized protein (UPF0332 family)
MDSEAKLYIQRAEDEFMLSEKDMKMSLDNEIKDILGIPQDKTFFHSVIGHAYYCIFYSAKAYLLSKGIRTTPPEEHKKTYEEFQRVVNSGKISKQLFAIYETETIKAETLLSIFFTEKKKRGIFTYNVKSQANTPYAKESIENAKKFASSIKLILEKEQDKQ